MPFRTKNEVLIGVELKEVEGVLEIDLSDERRGTKFEGLLEAEALAAADAGDFTAESCAKEPTDKGRFDSVPTAPSPFSSLAAPEVIALLGEGGVSSERHEERGTLRERLFELLCVERLAEEVGVTFGALAPGEEAKRGQRVSK